MAKIYRKVQLDSFKDLRKATRSIINSCKDLSRGRKIRKILNKKDKLENPMIINTLIHNNLLIVKSLCDTIFIKDEDLDIDFKNLTNEIIYSFQNQRDGYFKTIPKNKITDILKKHTKFFNKAYLSRHKIEIDNEEWQKTYLSALFIWGNNRN